MSLSLQERRSTMVFHGTNGDFGVLDSLARLDLNGDSGVLSPLARLDLPRSNSIIADILPMAGLEGLGCPEVRHDGLSRASRCASFLKKMRG